jgi:PAS domain S-box-containing protein
MTAAPTDDRLFRAVFEGTLDALLLADDDGIYVDANEAAGELFGCPSEELVGRSIAEFLPPEADFEAMWSSFLEDGEARGNLQLHRPDGDVRTVEFAATADIRPGVHLSAIRDVSEREADRHELRRRTELLTSVFETAPVGIVVVDADGRIVDANERAEVTLGLSREELADRTYDDGRWQAVREDGTPIPGEELPVARVLDTGEAVFDAEHGLVRDGETVWLSVNAAPIYEDGSIDRVVTVVSDITDRREYRRMLEAQNERLEEYSATVSHDLRGPLSVASGWLDVAIEEESVEPLEKVQSALDRMGDLITDLRQLGRYGQTVEELETLELRTLVESAWSNVETADATLEIESELGSIDGEEGRILQLFENLFRNAVEHGSTSPASQTRQDAVEHGSTSAHVTVGPLEDGFYVADDGPGIPEADREDVFEFGYSTTEHGTGIGLAVVEAVADAHGWRLDLLDADPHGARFEFRTGWHPDHRD